MVVGELFRVVVGGGGNLVLGDGLVVAVPEPSVVNMTSLLNHVSHANSCIKVQPVEKSSTLNVPYLHANSTNSTPVTIRYLL